MLKRLHIYLHEMFPVFDRLVASTVLFFGIYISGLYAVQQKLSGISSFEVIGALTIFGMLLSLRIVDELKDAKTDMVNFPKRPLPSGRVHVSDLVTLLVVVVVAMTVANLFFMPTPLFFVAMVLYASLMSVWFFARKFLQPNLVATLITHNPIQLLLVFYVLSIASAEYHFSVLDPRILLVAGAFYIPALVWEISRKIRAPKEENQYVTYSQIFGRTRAIWIVMSIFLVQLLAIAVVYGRDVWVVALVAVSFAVYVAVSIYNTKHPASFNYGKIARGYLYVTQVLLVVAALLGVL